jgi:peptidoglycan/xylan/chitin deacetylase (PgdA/CDA1 family)
LKENRYSIVNLRGLSESSPANSVCLTIDDGYESFLDEALPILTLENIPATLFILTDYVGRSNDWDLTLNINRRRHLTWEMIKEIHHSGVEIGSHTKTHRDLTRLSPTKVNEELTESKKILEDQLGVTVTSIALPFGAANLEIISAARQSGYLEICGGVPGWYGPIAGMLPRLPVYRGDSLKGLERKLKLQFFALLKARFLQSCSRTTRLIKG